MFAKLGQVPSTRADLLPPDVIAGLSGLQDHVPPAAPGTVEGFATALREELDFRIEARNTAAVAAGRSGQTRIPPSTRRPRRVLVLEWLDGVNVRDAGGRLAGCDRLALARGLLTTMLRQMLIDGTLDTTVVQVRDVPVSVLNALKARAKARGVSLSSFLRDLMANEAAMPPIDDVMAAIARREPVSCEAEDLRSFMEDGRR